MPFGTGRHPPLTAAAFEGRSAAVGALLARGADIRANGEFEMTGLALAAWGGHAEVVQMPEERGADVNFRSHQGWFGARQIEFKFESLPRFAVHVHFARSRSAAEKSASIQRNYLSARRILQYPFDLEPSTL